jgi:hypothetical protein
MVRISVFQLSVIAAVSAFGRFVDGVEETDGWHSLSDEERCPGTMRA